jgi:superkiller protein 3
VPLRLAAASLYQALSQDRRALDHLAVAKGLEPDRYEIHRYAGLSFLKLRMWPEAEAAYRSALARSSEDPQVHFELAQVYGLSGKAVDRAMDHLAYVLQLNPGYFPAMALRGDLLEEQGRFAEAVDAWEQVLAVAPRHAPTLNNLGRRRMVEGDQRAAIRYFNDCLAADPMFHAARLNRGASYLKDGRCDRARSDLDAVVKLGGVLGAQAEALLADCR